MGKRRALLITSVTTMLLASWPPTVGAQTIQGVPDCQGAEPTIVGTDGRDVLVGTRHADVIWAGPGNDVVNGAGGADLVCGGPGADVLIGGPGWDRLSGDLGNDACLPGENGGSKIDCEDITKPPTRYLMKVLVIRYYPLADDGEHIDQDVTGDVGGLLTEVNDHVLGVTNNVVADLVASSAYRPEADPAAIPSLLYQVTKTVTHYRAVPTVPNDDATYEERPNYKLIMSNHQICWHVDRGVNEVWIWAYQGPSQLGISESKMSGPFGDISNSYRLNDMPKCGRTYTAYTFNYGRGTAEAMESHGHQIEAELAHLGSTLFGLFMGPAYPSKSGLPGRCGSVHNPPNARFEYDRANPTRHKSDCDDWDPDGYGTFSWIGCQRWVCDYGEDGDDPPTQYMIWWGQHIPGRGNTITYNGHRLRNWWQVHGAWDAVLGAGGRLTL
jgi:hypothetical protein